MQHILKKTWRAALVGLTSLAAGAIFSAGVVPAQANGYGDRVSPAHESRHQSLIRVPDTEILPVRRNVRVGLGKSVLVEFPRDVRDVLVSNPQAVDAVVLSSNRVFLLARRIGESNAFFFDENGEQFATFELFVERETSGLESMLNRLIPGSNIKVEMLNATVVLTGSVRTPVDASRAANIAQQFVTVEFETKGTEEEEGTAVKKFEKGENELVINLLSVEAGEQVMLRVTVAEVQRQLLKQFGINVGAIVNSGNFSTRILTENALPLTAAAGLGTLPVAGIATATDAAGTLSMFNQGPAQNSDLLPFGNSGAHTHWRTGNQAVSKAIRALERNGLIKTLAEPNLTAVSGESANFLAGGEFPVPTIDSDGQLKVTFKEFGVGMAFTPIVMSEGRISLKIETEVSELTNTGAVTLNGFSIPALKTRQAKSTVELPSGGSLAMAGLLSNDVRQNIDGFPGLKDVPILGTLFRSRDFIKSETELVVIVTPYIVTPTARKNLARPDDGLAAASDMKAYFLGHINRVYGRGRHEAPVGDLKGDYGFIVE